MSQSHSTGVLEAQRLGVRNRLDLESQRCPFQHHLPRHNGLLACSSLTRGYTRENWYPEDIHVAPAFLLDFLRKLLRDVEVLETVGEFRRVDLEVEDYRV
jgi:hypothetical protein